MSLSHGKICLRYFCKSYCQRKIGTFLSATLYIKHHIFIVRCSLFTWFNLQILTNGNKYCYKYWNTVNPFHATDFFWYPLKTSENQRFFDVFRGYQERSMAWNGNEERQCENVRYRKKQVFLLFYHQFAIKTKKIQHIIFEIFPQKNSLQNLKWALWVGDPINFHNTLLLKTIIWTWIVVWQSMAECSP